MYMCIHNLVIHVIIMYMYMYMLVRIHASVAGGVWCVSTDHAGLCTRRGHGQTTGLSTPETCRKHSYRVPQETSQSNIMHTYMYVYVYVHSHVHVHVRMNTYPSSVHFSALSIVIIVVQPKYTHTHTHTHTLPPTTCTTDHV